MMGAWREMPGELCEHAVTVQKVASAAALNLAKFTLEDAMAGIRQFVTVCSACNFTYRVRLRFACICLDECSGNPAFADHRQCARHP